MIKNDDFQKFERFFNKFVSQIKVTPENKIKIDIKIRHTKKVIKVGQILTKQLKLDLNLCKTLCLLHDIGRFKQVEKYNTFNDLKSFDHANLSMKIIRESKILDLYPDKKLILTAIKYHNKICYEVPKLKEPINTYVKFLRDADKVDIYRSLYDFKTYANVSLPFNKKTVDSFLNKDQCDKHHIQNKLDHLILSLSWIFDINFPETLVLLKKQGYIQKLLELLPEDKTLNKVKQIVLDKLFQIKI